MPTLVADLVDLGGNWKHEVIELCFNEDDACTILSIPPSRFGCPDGMMWHYTRNGVYSVKFGYMVAQEMSRNGELGWKSVGQPRMSDNRDSVWKDIWRLKVPSKLCHFVWKGCRNILAVRPNLQRWKIRLEPSCPFCEGEVET